MAESCDIDRVALSAPASVPASSRLADHTTLRVGGEASRFVVGASEADIVATVLDCDHRGEPVLVLSGGSNMLVSDEGFDGTVVRMATTGLSADVSACGGALVRVDAGVAWDALVATAVERGWSGIEALSGIPGLVGATPIQNVGAYGADVSQTIASVRTLDRTTGEFATFPLAGCGFGYRTSRFKAEPGRYVILQVSFQFPLGTLSAPIRYAELARHLGVQIGERADAALVRDAVLAIRRSKAMVLDAADHDTWSAGSFFTNPIVDEDVPLPDDAPRFPAGDGQVKTSAAWLIENAGFAKGYRNGRAGLSSKHVLALTNRGDATASEIVALAREVRDGVEAAFGIVLVPEPVLIGVNI